MQRPRRRRLLDARLLEHGGQQRLEHRHIVWMHFLEGALADALGDRVAQETLRRLAQKQYFPRGVHEDDGIGAVFDQRLKQVAGCRRVVRVRYRDSTARRRGERVIV
jgi:hypothetical protein